MLKIDKEFEKLINPLSDEEYKQLEQNIIDNGCLDSIKVLRIKYNTIFCKNCNKDVEYYSHGDYYYCIHCDAKIKEMDFIIIDGHNRYKICTENDIEFEAEELNFDNREDVKIWIIKNQLGRRNLSNYQRGQLALAMEGIFREWAKVNQLSGLKQYQKDTVCQKSVNYGSDKEEWKLIDKYTDKYISNYGRVKYISALTGDEQISSLSKSATGYLNITLRNNDTGYRNTFQVHRLVAKYFLDNPDNKPEVNHKNKIRTDNHYLNLEWNTKSENNYHRSNTKTSPIDTKKELAKLAGISHDTMAKIKVIEEKATEETKEKLANQEISINKAYKEVKKEEKKKQRIKDNKKAIQESKSNIILLHGDIFDAINRVDDNSIDCLFTDPPYNVMNDYEWDMYDQKDFLEFTDRWLKIVKTKLKPNYTGFIFMDSRQMYDVAGVINKYFQIKNTIIWVRKNMAKGRVVKDKFISAYEAIFYFSNRELNLPSKWGEERFDVQEYAVPQTNYKDVKQHPTQKPAKLFESLLSIATVKDDLVLDCFAGSGTTGYICKKLNRDCILIEKENDYIKIIKERLAI